MIARSLVSRTAYVTITGNKTPSRLFDLVRESGDYGTR